MTLVFLAQLLEQLQVAVATLGLALVYGGHKCDQAELLLARLVQLGLFGELDERRSGRVLGELVQRPLDDVAGRAAAVEVARTRLAVRAEVLDGRVAADAVLLRHALVNGGVYRAQFNFAF